MSYSDLEDFVAHWPYPAKAFPSDVRDFVVPYDPFLQNCGLPFDNALQHPKHSGACTLQLDLPKEGLKILDFDDPFDYLCGPQHLEGVDTEELSRKLSSILRHENFGRYDGRKLALDSGGWADIRLLAWELNISVEVIVTVAREVSEGRFEILIYRPEGVPSYLGGTAKDNGICWLPGAVRPFSTENCIEDNVERVQVTDEDVQAYEASQAKRDTMNKIWRPVLKEQSTSHEGAPELEEQTQGTPHGGAPGDLNPSNPFAKLPPIPESDRTEEDASKRRAAPNPGQKAQAAPPTSSLEERPQDLGEEAFGWVLLCPFAP
jgi:hypothetical protein